MDANTAQAAEQADSFFSIDIEDLLVPLSEFDVHLLHESTDKPTLYNATGATLTDDDHKRLLETGVRRVYAPVWQHGKYRKLLLERIEAEFQRQDDSDDRVARVRSTAHTVIAEVLRYPGTKEPALTVLDLGRLLHRWLFEATDRYAELLNLSMREYTLAAHSLNVAITSGLVSRAMRPRDPELALEVIQGALLHDIGKRGFDDETLTRQGSLSAKEWRMVSKHPARAYDELRAYEALSEGALSVIRDHHERLDGEGFPRGIEGDDIDLGARICAVTDTLDNLCCARPNRRPIHPMDVLELMNEGVGAHFDPLALTALTLIVQDLVRSRQSRIGCSRCADLRSTLPSITKILQSPPSGMAAYIPPSRSASESIWARERRRGKRMPYQAVVMATLVRQGKPTEAPDGTEVELRSLDVSGGGMQVCTPWAFSQGDLLLLRLTAANGKTILQHGRVVRVRKRTDGMWSAGVEFLAHAGRAGEPAPEAAPDPAAAGDETAPGAAADEQPRAA